MILLALGSNIGNKEANIDRAIGLIEETLGCAAQRSRLYETAPWGYTMQNNFLNMVVSVQTKLPPDKLLSELQNIERILGKEKIIRWGPRIIDIDILLYNDEIIDTDRLKVPHPFLAMRDFFLLPSIELFPDIVHPVSNIPFDELLDEIAESDRTIISVKQI